MRFVGDGEAAFGFELERALEEANALVLGEGVLPAVGVDEARGKRLGDGNLLAQRVKVLSDRLAVGEDLRDELQTVLPEQGTEPFPVFGWGHWALDSPVAGLLEPREEALPLTGCAPQMAEKHQVHAPLHLTKYLPC